MSACRLFGQQEATDLGPYILRSAFLNRATLCISAAIAVVAWLPVCHTLVLYRNGKRDHQTFFSPCSPTTVLFWHHIRLRNANGKGNLSLGWTSDFFRSENAL